MNFIKNFVINSGRFIVDLSAVIILFIIFATFIFAIIAGIGGSAGNENYTMFSWGAIITVPILLAFFICCFYFVYVVIDILDTLKNINQNIEENNMLFKNIKANPAEIETENSGLMKFVKNTRTH